MRVLHFFKTALPDTIGGIEQTIHHIASGTVRRGGIVDVLSLAPTDSPASLQPAGYTLHRARKDIEIASMGLSWSGLRKFSLLSREADIVHYHFPWPFMDLAHFLVRVRKPCVVTYHSDIVRQTLLFQVYRPLQAAFLRSVDRIVATSPNYTKTSAALSQFESKCEVITIGVDRQNYPKPKQDRLSYWKNRYGDRFFLFVGVLRYYKGLHILLEAARRVDYPVVIAGAGPIERQLKEQARQLGLTNVHFIGHICDDDRSCLLTLAFAVVFPSHLRSEAFGISLLEGAMFGKPMISSEIGTGTSHINIAEMTGLVVPPSNPDALAAAMARLWNDPELAKSMGKAAEQRYESHFRCEQMVDAYIQIYRELLGT